MSYVHKYIKEDRLWCVGYYRINPDKGQEFRTLRECGSSDEAAAFINYLNGGTGDGFPWDKNNA